MQQVPERRISQVPGVETTGQEWLQVLTAKPGRGRGDALCDCRPGGAATKSHPGKDSLLPSAERELWDRGVWEGEEHRCIT